MLELEFDFEFECNWKGIILFVFDFSGGRLSLLFVLVFFILCLEEDFGRFFVDLLIVCDLKVFGLSREWWKELKWEIFMNV